MTTMTEGSGRSGRASRPTVAPPGWPASCESRVRATAAAAAGHPTSGASAADLIAVLGAAHFRYDVDDPGHAGNDRFVLSKGHASTLLYAWLKTMGAINDEELLTYAQPDSRLEGHPRPSCPGSTWRPDRSARASRPRVGLALSLQRLEQLPGPGLRAMRRQRDGRRLGMGSVRARGLLSAWTTSS